MVLRLKTRESRSLPGLQSATKSSHITKIGTAAGRISRPVFALNALSNHQGNPRARAAPPKPREQRSQGRQKKPGRSRSAQNLTRGMEQPPPTRRSIAPRTGKAKKSGQIPERSDLNAGHGAAPADPQEPRSEDRQSKKSGQIPESSKLNAGWSSPVARQAHNLKVAGSNPAPATKS